MFHLDQAMILLPNRVAGVANIVGKYPSVQKEAGDIKEVEYFLSELRSSLLKLGYEIINIDTSVYSILNNQHYVNAIPYVDAKTKQKTLLMPVFSVGSVEKSLEKKNKNVFESRGYKDIPVYTTAFENKGGIHCLINVLE